MKPLVSVVIPTYNAGRYIREAVESVIQQTYGVVEIIVVDDGSTDATTAVLKPYIDSRAIIYVKQENGGSMRARNVGVQYATGEFIAFLDADDVWMPEKLEKQMVLFTHDVCLVYSGRLLLDDQGHLTDSREIPRRGHVLKDLLRNNFITNSSVVVRRSILEKVGHFNEAANVYGLEDYDLWLRIVPHCAIDYVDLPLVKYRIHADQISTRSYTQVVRNLFALHFRLLFKKGYRKYAAINLRKLLYLARVLIFKNKFLSWSKEYIKK